VLAWLTESASASLPESDRNTLALDSTRAVAPDPRPVRATWAVLVFTVSRPTWLLALSISR